MSNDKLLALNYSRQSPPIHIFSLCVCDDYTKGANEFLLETYRNNDNQTTGPSRSILQISHQETLYKSYKKYGQNAINSQ